MNIVKADPMAELMSKAEVEKILNGPYLMRLAFLEDDGSPAGVTEGDAGDVW